MKFQHAEMVAQQQQLTQQKEDLQKLSSKLQTDIQHEKDKNLNLEKNFDDIKYFFARQLDSYQEQIDSVDQKIKEYKTTKTDKKQEVIKITKYVKNLFKTKIDLNIGA